MFELEPIMKWCWNERQIFPQSNKWQTEKKVQKVCSGGVCVALGSSVIRSFRAINQGLLRCNSYLIVSFIADKDSTFG